MKHEANHTTRRNLTHSEDVLYQKFNYLESQPTRESISHRSDSFENRGTRSEWEENILDIQMQEFDTSAQQLSSTSTMSLSPPNRGWSASSSLSNVCVTTPKKEPDNESSLLFKQKPELQDANDEYVIVQTELMAADQEGVGPEHNANGKFGEDTMPQRDTTNAANQDPSYPRDEPAVAYIERLLAAIERLRGERDTLRRNVHFLETEMNVAMEMLEAKKASASDHLDMVTDATNSTVPSRDPPADPVKAEKGAECRRCPSLRKAELAANASAVVIWHMQQQADAVVSRFSADHETLRRQLEEKDQQLEALAAKLQVTEQCVGEATESQNDLRSQLSRLQCKDEERLQEIERLKDVLRETQDTLEHTTSDLAEVTASLEVVESERDTLTSYNHNLQTDLFRAQEAVNEAENRYSNLQFHRLSSDDVSQSLRMQVEDLEDRVLRRTEQIGIHQHDIRRLETNLRLQEERVAEMTLELEMISAQKEAMVEDCADAREARDDAVRKVETMDMEMEELEGRAELLEGMLESLERERDQEVTTLIAITFDMINRSRNAIKNPKNEAVRQAQNDTSANTLRQMTLALATSQVELQRTVRSLRTADEAPGSLTHKTAVESELEHLHSHYATELTNVKNQLERTLNELEQVRQLHADATARYREESSESARIKQELADHLKGSADRSKVEEDELNKLRIEHADEIRLLQKQRDDLSDETRDANESRAKLEILHQRTMDDLTRVERDYETRFTRVSERSRDVILYLEAEVTERTDQLISLKARLGASEEEVGQLTRKLEEEDRKSVV